MISIVLTILLCVVSTEGRTLHSSVFALPASPTHTKVFRRLPRWLLNTRGGSDEEPDDFSDEEDEEESSDEEDLFDTLEFGDDADDDFAEDNTVDRMYQAFKDTPPLTKGYLTASFLATFAAYMAKTDFPPLLLLDWNKVIYRFQIWRPFTTFLNFGRFGLPYALTIQFVWTYMSTLESLHHHMPYDFWIMIAFGMLSMVVAYPIIGVSPKFLGHNLSTFLVYVWSRYHEGVDVTMFEVFKTRAEMLPWLFLAQTFLLEGEIPLMDFLGIAFGHIYHHCKTVGLLRAPESVVRWYKESDSAAGIRKRYKKISSHFEVV
eukprot:scaffold1525_cov142-Cylindrotheca_fusiformis.AAC.116